MQTDDAVAKANVAMSRMIPGGSILPDTASPVMESLSTMDLGTFPAQCDALLQNVKAFTKLMDKISEVR